MSVFEKRGALGVDMSSRGMCGLVCAALAIYVTD